VEIELENDKLTLGKPLLHWRLRFSASFIRYQSL